MEISLIEPVNGPNIENELNIRLQQTYNFTLLGSLFTYCNRVTHGKKWHLLELSAESVWRHFQSVWRHILCYYWYRNQDISVYLLICTLELWRSVGVNFVVWWHLVSERTFDVIHEYFFCWQMSTSHVGSQVNGSVKLADGHFNLPREYVRVCIG